MNVTGVLLREKREELGLSQAKLAEMTGVPQHQLSAFELSKIDISEDTKRHIIDIIDQTSQVNEVAVRKKRYQAHTYTAHLRDERRRKAAALTAGNASYLQALNSLSNAPAPEFTGVSLFSGIGGFSSGFRAAGCDIKGFVELDDKLAAIYQANFPSTTRIGGDIASVTDNEISTFSRQAGPIDILIGGPPCQGFSLSGKRDVDDARNELFREYMRFVDILNPRIALLENVRLLTSMKSKTGTLVKAEIQKAFIERGYRTSMYEINAKEFGVPQHRERVVFVAIRGSDAPEPTLPPPLYGGAETLFADLRPFRTFGDACSDLPFIETGERGDDPYHAAVHHPDHVIRWLWDVEQGQSAHDNTDPSLRPPSGYNTTYKRQVWNEPASTVQTTFGMISGCRNVHPIATRALTVREAARIQSFPDSYKFKGALGTVRTGIGNAVPPLLAYHLAKHLRSTVLNLVEIPSL